MRDLFFILLYHCPYEPEHLVRISSSNLVLALYRNGEMSSFSNIVRGRHLTVVFRPGLLYYIYLLGLSYLGVVINGTLLTRLKGFSVLNIILIVAFVSFKCVELATGTLTRD